MNCRLCESTCELFLSMTESALEVSALYQKPTTKKGVPIDLYLCSRCVHFQIADTNTSDYYDDYLMTTSYSEKMQKLQTEQANVLADFASAKDYFLEVGCGDGNFLQKVKPVFKDVVGVEPSKVFYEICQKNGLNVINEYLTDDIQFEHAFNGFASRQVFEHLSDPKKVLSTVSKICAPAAVGLIEVPNAQKMIAENRYFDLFSDHLNYFTPSSLCALARSCGFEIIMVRESFNGDYLELYVRKPNGNSSMVEKRDKDLDFIRKTCEEYEKVSVWGAGAKTQALMTVIGQDLNLAYIFDSDPNKRGKYVANSQASIAAPSRDKVCENDLIMIFAASYQDEIIAQLREFGYQGKVLGIKGDPFVSTV